MKTDIPKTFLLIEEKPMFLYAVETFLKVADEVVLVVSAEMVSETQKILDKFLPGENVNVVSGGAERYDSSYQGILKAGGDLVLIHDAARPFVSASVISEIISETAKCGAAIPVIPVKDTIKIVSDQIVLETPKRSTLFAVQTPQGFRRDLILQGYEAMRQSGEKDDITDDAMIFERFCEGVVKTVPGDEENFKVTTPEDFLRAKLKVQTEKI